MDTCLAWSAYNKPIRHEKMVTGMEMLEAAMDIQMALAPPGREQAHFPFIGFKW